MVRQRGKLRAKAVQFIAQGQKLFEKKKWEKGSESIQKSVELEAADLPLRNQAVSALLQAAELALPSALALPRTWQTRLLGWIPRLLDLQRSERLLKAANVRRS